MGMSNLVQSSHIYAGLALPQLKFNAISSVNIQAISADNNQALERTIIDLANDGTCFLVIRTFTESYLILRDLYTHTCQSFLAV